MAFPKLPNGMVSGKLRPSEKRKIAEKLAEKGFQDPPCELCSTRKWQLGDYLVAPQGIARHSDKTLMEAPADPVHLSVLLFCANCGNTKALNAFILDAFDIMDVE